VAGVGKGKRTKKRPGQAWYRASEKHRWRERAQAWDDDVRAKAEPRVRSAHERYLGCLDSNSDRIETLIERLMAVPPEQLRGRVSDVARLAATQEHLTRQRAIIEARELKGGEGVDPEMDGLTGPKTPAFELVLPDNGRGSSE
jgi:uncharacterized NAD(P)/FAD-binding protein YdhS